MPRENSNTPPGPDVPDLGESVPPGRHQAFADASRGAVGWLPRNVGDPLGVGLDLGEVLTFDRVPEYEEAVLVGRGKAAAVGGPGGAEDMVLVGEAGVFGEGGVYVPEADGCVSSTRSEVFSCGSVWWEGWRFWCVRAGKVSSACRND